ncbi:hypothetical protein [Aurantiacibacter spongiae]|uniref:Uncharacterized protein n=1 Tax=Aurantiacibacter spongiae TaxID=2488860 RepID=A0A3N5CS73_9SPHN|nr:hypothetical protein [Aurantiacibacter spongiae]RPF71437.1 hypothetical protein EG799_07280 [Aurantiacibacter spongiae]
MSPRLLRTLGLLSLAIALVLAVIYSGEEIGMIDLLGSPEGGAIGMGVLGLVLLIAARRRRD